MKSFLLIISIFISTAGIAQTKTDCTGKATAAARAIESTYGEYNYTYAANLITELDYTEVSGSMLYQIDVDYGGEVGKYFVTMTKNFPGIDCVIANVQYLGNMKPQSQKK
jgi:hypothetical protein